MRKWFDVNEPQATQKIGQVSSNVTSGDITNICTRYPEFRFDS